MKHIVAFFILGGLAFSNCKAMSPSKLITIALLEEKQNATITVHKGDMLLVKLPMASGTGFVWEVAPGKLNVCKQEDTKYVSIKRSMPGAPQLELISFSMTASGTTDIYFIYHRPFETNKAPAKTRKLHLIVQ